MSFLTKSYANTANTIIENLKKRNMNGYYCQDAAQARELLEKLIPEQSTVTWGGSETLNETGIMDMLKEKNFRLIDRKNASTPEEARKLYGEIVTADYFLTGTNAITLDGELVNVDGNGNRVACLITGPSNVIVVTGINKVTATEEDAIRRVRSIAAPPNSIRVGANTPCSKTGRCADCQSSDCICCQTVITRRSRVKDRITVVIIGESFGF